MNKDNIAKLSELRKEALKILKEYNALAKKENFGTRVGVIDAVVDDDMFEDYATDESEDGKIEKPKDIAKWLSENDATPYWNTTFPGVKEYCWSQAV